LVRAGLSQEEMQNTESLEDLIILDNKDGKKIFNQFVKPSRLYIQNPPAYRTYLLKNIKNIEEVRIKKEILLNYLK
jgi:hypothetical protein